MSTTTTRPMPTGGTVLYVGTLFQDRGFDQTHRRAALRGTDAAAPGALTRMVELVSGNMVRRQSLRTIALANGRQTLCSHCRTVLDVTAPCPGCDLRVGAIWDPSLPVTVMGLPNVAVLSGRQAAQEFFDFTR